MYVGSFRIIDVLGYLQWQQEKNIRHRVTHIIICVGDSSPSRVWILFYILSTNYHSFPFRVSESARRQHPLPSIAWVAHNRGSVLTITGSICLHSPQTVSHAAAGREWDGSAAPAAAGLGDQRLRQRRYRATELGGASSGTWGGGQERSIRCKRIISLKTYVCLYTYFTFF